MSEQPGKYQRSTGGLIGALLVAVALVVGFVALRDLNRTEVETEVPTVDYRKVLEVRGDELDFEPVAPASLPDGWKATSARLSQQPPRWHLGVLTDEDRYIGLEQSRGSEESMVRKYVDERAVDEGMVDVAGERWRVWSDDGGDHALSRVEDGVTTVVVGTPDADELADYVTTLR